METSSVWITCTHGPPPPPTPDPPPVHHRHSLSRLPGAMHFVRDQQHSLFSIITVLSRVQLEPEEDHHMTSGWQLTELTRPPCGDRDEAKAFIYSGSSLINITPEVNNGLFQKNNTITSHLPSASLGDPCWCRETSPVIQSLLFPLFHFIVG